MAARPASQLIFDGFALAHQRLRLILIDAAWRGIWLGLSGALLAGLLVWFATEVRSLEWQGPDLAASRPIILLNAALQLWNLYAMTLFWAGLGFTALAGLLWITLEAYFRGGRKEFWLFLASSMVRVVILAAATLFLGILVSRDASRWSLFPAAVVLFGLTLMVVIFETLVRRDAVDLLATDLGGIVAIVGLSFVFEVLTFLLFGLLCVAFILGSSRPVEFAISGVFSVTALMLWSIFHSYLLVVRLSTVDIMRDDASV